MKKTIKLEKGVGVFGGSFYNDNRDGLICSKRLEKLYGQKLPNYIWITVSTREIKDSVKISLVWDGDITTSMHAERFIDCITYEADKWLVKNGFRKKNIYIKVECESTR